MEPLCIYTLELLFSRDQIIPRAVDLDFFFVLLLNTTSSNTTSSSVVDKKSWRCQVQVHLQGESTGRLSPVLTMHFGQSKVNRNLLKARSPASSFKP